MSRVSLVVSAVIALPAIVAPPARADDVVTEAERAVTAASAAAAQVRQLGETARDVRDLLYYLSDPRGFQYDYYRAADEVMRDPILGALAHNLLELYRHRRWEAKLQAQAMGDTATPASAAVGAGITWDAPLCRLFEAQGSAQGFYDEGDPQLAAAWGVGACLPLPFDTFELGYRGRRRVRRSLLARPLVVGDRDTGDTVYANLRFFRWLSTGHQVDVGPMSFQFDWVRTDATTFQSWASIAPARWARRGRGFEGRDQTYDFVRTQFTTLGIEDDREDPLAVAISPLAIDGIMVADQIALGLDVAWGAGEWSRPDGVRVQHEALHLDVGVTTRVGPAVAELHALNTMSPTLANQVLDEQRLTARVDLDRRAAWLRLDGFASHARLLGAERFSARVWTWGVGADATFALTPEVFLYARAEGARNVVVDETSTTPATARDVRVTGGITAELRRGL